MRWIRNTTSTSLPCRGVGSRELHFRHATSERSPEDSRNSCHRCIAVLSESADHCDVWPGKCGICILTRGHVVFRIQVVLQVRRTFASRHVTRFVFSSSRHLHTGPSEASTKRNTQHSTHHGIRWHRELHRLPLCRSSLRWSVLPNLELRGDVSLGKPDSPRLLAFLSTFVRFP